MRKTLTLAGALALLACGALAAGEPTPEAPLPVHEERDAYTPCAAFGKDVYLVAWQSGRFAEGDLREGLVGAADLVGCRVDASGKVLDEKPFIISGADDFQERPQVAFGEDTFLVVWQDLRNGKDYDTYAARVSADGKVLDADGVLVAGGAHNQANPHVAFDGKAFVVAWQDFRSERFYEVRGARVSPEGKGLDPAGIDLASSKTYHCHSPAVASAGEGKSLVVWLGMGRAGNAYKDPASGGLFLSEGKASEAFREKTSRDHGPGRNAVPVWLGAGPKGYLAAWRTDAPSGRGNAPGKSSAAIYDEKGKRTKSFFLAGKAHRIRGAGIAWDGSAFAVAWHENKTLKPRHSGPYPAVFATRVSPEGEPGEAVHLSGSFESPAAHATVASDGKGATLIAYERHPNRPAVPIRIGFRLLRAK